MRRRERERKCATTGGARRYFKTSVITTNRNIGGTATGYIG